MAATKAIIPNLVNFCCHGFSGDPSSPFKLEALLLADEDESSVTWATDASDVPREIDDEDFETFRGDAGNALS